MTTIITRLVRMLVSATLLAGSIVFSGRSPATTSPAATGPKVVTQRLLVKLQPGADLHALEIGQAQVVSAKPLLFGPADPEPDPIYVLEVTGQAALAAERLAANPAVAWVEPDHQARSAGALAPAQNPNDPLFSQQWGLSKIQAPAAWDTTTGTSDLVIAILDSGIELNHPDLADKLWVNPGEVPGNGLDDDNNGYVDDVNGWNFVAGNNNVADDMGHGTQVAGIAAAASDNAQGIAGTCWGCRLLPVKVMSAAGVANYSDIAAGVLYAAVKGADVINISLGGYADSAALQAAVQAARNTYGAVVVGGAGNDNVETPFYPAAYPEVLAVAGTTLTDTKASFSDYGDWVDVCAPAVNILSTRMGDDWGPAEGTSYGAPFVTGVAGLVRSQHPDWSPAEVQAQILHTADSLEALNPGYAGKLGAGRVSANHAVTTTPHPELSVASTRVDGKVNGTVKAGQPVNLEVNLANHWLNAASVAGTLSSSDPAVTISQNTATWGAIPSGSEAANTDTPFIISVPAGLYNHVIPFSLQVNAGGHVATLTFSVSTESQAVNVGGVISADTTWTSDRVYLANNVVVDSGVTLTIEPGTVIKFNAGKSLVVKGVLIADGTAEKPIRFTSAAANPQPGDWGYVTNPAIQFLNGGQGAVFDAQGNYISGRILRHTIIEYAYQGVMVSGPTPFISHSLLQYNRDYSLLLVGDPSTMLVYQNQFLNNRGYINLSGGTADFRGNLIAGNEGGIYIGGTHTVISNTFSANTATIGCHSASAVICISGPGNSQVFHHNNIVGNQGTYDVVMGTMAGSTGGNVNGVQNYWGTTDTGAIQERIYDLADNIEAGALLIDPVLTAPEPSAPAFLEKVTTQPASPIGIQTATFDLSFSAPVDLHSTPLVSFERQHPWSVYDNTNSGLPLNYNIYAIQQHGGKMWFATAAGLVSFDGAHWTVYNSSNSGIKFFYINAVAFDRDGSLWLTGNGFMDNGVLKTDSGLVHFDGAQWTVFDAPKDTSGAVIQVSGLLIDAAGTKWMNSGSYGLMRFKDGVWTRETPADYGQQQLNLNTLAIAPDGALWLGLFGNGVVRKQGEAVTHYTKANSGLPDDNVTAFAFDVDGGAWIATDGGLAHFADNTWTTYNPANSTASTEVMRFLVMGADNSLWAASFKNVFHFENGAWIGMSRDSLPDNDFSTIGTDGRGSVWLGSMMGQKSFVASYRDFHDSLSAGAWIDGQRWRASYDITSLMPRDSYALIITGITGNNGMILPTRALTFTVDYAGAISDLKPPQRPTLTVCAGSAAGTLNASWSAVSNGTPTNLFQYALGMTPGSAEVLNWTNTTSASLQKAGLLLTAGQAYYLSVRARNAGGLWSEVTSVKFTAGSGLCVFNVTHIYAPLVSKQ